MGFGDYGSSGEGDSLNAKYSTISLEPHIRISCPMLGCSVQGSLLASMSEVS